MQIDVLTLFPEMFSGTFDHSIVKRAKNTGVVTIQLHNIRDWTTDTYKTVDDRPYGGGAGMVMRVDVIDRAVAQLRKPDTHVILLDAGGERYTQKKASVFSQHEHLIFICGHYEGVDHRVHEHIADEIISIGDYVLSGGEIPAMVIIDSIVRLRPGALGNHQSLVEESHNTDTTEYPQYTRPETYNSWSVPPILLSGDHKKITAWRKSKEE